VERVLSWDDAIAALRGVYSRPLRADASPPRVMARGEGLWLRCLAAAPPGARFMGAKLFGLSRRRSVNYLIALFEQETGLLAALVDGAHVTSIRTAATTAAALDRLAPAAAATVAVLGSGAEAQAHLRAFAAIRPLAAVRLYSPTPARREAFAASFRGELGVAVTPCPTAEEAVHDAGVVIAAARSRDESPILYGSWLRPDALVASIGSTIPEQREIDASVVAACDAIVCDAVDEVVHETGDMLAAAAAGVAFAGKLVSLNELLMGGADERIARSRRTLFKSVGSALQDVVVAELAFERATALGLSTELPMSLYEKQV
jgi:ornithine cyclodeaminase/alanine dehydrogenase